MIKMLLAVEHKRDVIDKAECWRPHCVRKVHNKRHVILLKEKSQEGIRWYFAETHKPLRDEENWRHSQATFSRCVISVAKTVPLEEQFSNLAKKWKSETKGFSLAASKINNNNYLAIIGLGVTYQDKILRLILQDLSESPSYWHYALKKITGQNPVPQGSMHNIQKTTEMWLNWGVEKGLIE